MFGLSVEKLFILAVVALFVLGPERLPAAAAWLARTVRQIRDYAGEANEKLRHELGPEFDEIRAPLNDLHSGLSGLRTWRDPRAAVMRHLREEPTTPGRYPPRPDGWEPTSDQQPASAAPLGAGERPPIDPDTT
ncbi:MAG: Sec-independent protein translocase TatB [Pseudonocardiales bacterium]|nr:MAG: Sec-independent protein translocase TatB [Pseudonocardiales bacterium]